MSRTDAGINQHRAARNRDRNWVETEIKYRVWHDSLTASRETGSFNGSMQRHPGRELKQDPKQLGSVLRAGGSVNSFWWKKNQGPGNHCKFLVGRNQSSIKYVDVEKRKHGYLLFS